MISKIRFLRKVFFSPWNQITALSLYKDLTLRLKSDGPPHRVLQLLDATLVLPHIRYLTLVDPTSSKLGGINVLIFLSVKL